MPRRFVYASIQLRVGRLFCYLGLGLYKTPQLCASRFRLWSLTAFRGSLRPGGAQSFARETGSTKGSSLNVGRWGDRPMLKDPCRLLL